MFCALRHVFARFRSILSYFLDCPQAVSQVVEFLGADSLTESEVLSRTPQWTLARYLRPNDAKRHAAWDIWDFGRCSQPLFAAHVMTGFCGICMGLSQDWLRHHYFQDLPIYFCSPKLHFSIIFGYMSCFLD